MGEESDEGCRPAVSGVKIFVRDASVKEWDEKHAQSF